VSVLTAVLFVHVERTVAKPVFPLRLIAPSPYRNVLVSTICCQIVLHGLYFNLPIYFQAVLLDAPTASGLRLVMAAAAGLVSGSACGLTIARYGRTNPCMQFGVPLMVAAAAVACFFQRDWADYTYSLTLAAVLFGGGWYFPGSYVTVLAASEQRDQPAANTVVITTRSIGLVLGISTSSLVMQNSLKAYLAELVAGPDRERVIELVREAVEAVGRLEEPYLGQVIASYEAACRTTFATLVGFGVVGMVAVWGIREVPRIRKRA
jgi:MFS family permease